MYTFSESTTVDLSKSAFSDYDYSLCKSLTIYHHKSPQSDFCNLPQIDGLECLRIYFTNAASFFGLERYSMLSCLEIRHCPRLTSIGDTVSFGKLESLEIENAAKLCDYSRIGELTSLKMLSLNECGDIDKLDFLLNIPNLREFRFIGTKISGGDLSCLMMHPSLVSVVGHDRRTYSHKLSDINCYLENGRRN